MKILSYLLKYSLPVLAVLFFARCGEDESESYPTEPMVKLSAARAPGNGQYKEKLESGDEISVDVEVSSSVSVKEFTIRKTVNLEPDPSFGNNGVVSVTPSGSPFQYAFDYTPTVDDVDKLVGFTFVATDGNGNQHVSDLTLVVTLSPRDNLPRRKWLWKSKKYVDGGNAEDIKECEKDNYYLFNQDSTMSLNYGDNTGASGCEFDGLNVYYEWYLSEDEKFFTMKYYSLFAPDNITTETYRVTTLTTEKLELEIDYDLTWLGLGPEETFRFEFVAQPK